MSEPTRVCGRCHSEKGLEAFPIKDKIRGTRRSYCLPCCRGYSREHYQRNKSYYLAKGAGARKRARTENHTFVDDFLLSHGCIDCGETDPVVLDFDHVDPKLKHGNVARMQHTAGRKRLAVEMDKCVVRCGNCHRRRTAQQFGWWRTFLAAHAQ